MEAILKRTLRAICVVIVAFIVVGMLTACSSAGSATPAVGTISIDSVTPNSDLQDGTTYTFTVTVTYSLNTGQGEINLGFNNGSAVSSYIIIDSRIVDSGNATIDIAVDAAAKDWGTEGDFKAYANISEFPHPDSWSPLDSDRMVLTLQ